MARALAADPPMLLMDEPFSAVDPIVRSALQDEFVALQRRVHKTIVFVTHDIDEAIKLADYIAILNVGGVLEQYGPPVAVLADRERIRARVPRRDRALKRLALMRCRRVDLQPGPMVDVASSVANAREVMAGKASTGSRCSTRAALGGTRRRSSTATIASPTSSPPGSRSPSIPRIRYGTRSTRW